MIESTAEKLRRIARLPAEEVLKDLNTCNSGLNPADAENRKNGDGEKSRESLALAIVRSFINPFAVILLVVAVVAVISGYFAKESDNYISAGIILFIVIQSGIIQSVQNVKAHRSFRNLGRFSEAKVTVKRGGIFIDIPSSELVEGDIVLLTAGCRVPADLRVLLSRELRISQAAVTGESNIVKKINSPIEPTEKLPLTKFGNLIFGGSAVISGEGEAVVVSAGKDTLFGSVPKLRKNVYYKGAGNIVKILSGFILFFVPVSLLVAGLTTHSLQSAVLFALSVAVGIVPEMLPMVVSVCLYKGTRAMSKKKTLVRNVNTMQGFGGIDVLCVDKTGTLTNNEINLEYYLDPLGNESERAIDLAYLNAHFHNGAKNYIDHAILKFRNHPRFDVRLAALTKKYTKLDEIPFSYERRHATVLLSDGKENILIAKGSIDEVISRCAYVKCGDEIVPMPEDRQSSVYEVVGDLLSDGMKVLAVAQKITEKDRLEVSDESDMALVGYLVFFDAPKNSAKEAVKRLKDCSVNVLVLTGDDVEVAISVCKRIGIPYEKNIKGAELENLSDEKLAQISEDTKVFAELTPEQKVRIVNFLKKQGHTVGYLGDGINDIPALCAADVAISVDTAQDAAKDVADVLLLEKDLNVLADGIFEGRKIFTNMQKYVKITLGSNFGNVLALVLASIFLSFRPMIAVQLLLLNILYDLLCFTISWDNVDREELLTPKSWTGRKTGRFAIIFGSVSTLFDVITFFFLYFVFCPWAAGGQYATLSGEQLLQFIALFQTGWFLESMWSQILVLNILRTHKIPFLQSRPSLPFIIIMIAGVVLFTIIPFTPLGAMLGFAAMPPLYFAYLAVAVLFYVALVYCVKWLYVKKFGDLI